MSQTTVLIIGASIAGMACAATLKKHGIDYILIEKEAQTVTPWRNHYERLHLHTPKSLSHLPYKKWGNKISRYPSRRQVVDYLEDYQKEYSISPLFNTEAKGINKTTEYWITETNSGIFQSKYIIIATGIYSKPKTFDCRGIETFPGTILHSSKYKTGRDFSGQNVLVIGFGNSACEIAIDLFEQGANPSMSVRSPVNVIPRDLLGFPILQIGLLLSKLPPRLADSIISPIMQLTFGDITELGLKKMPCGVFEQVEKNGIVPLIDLGVIKHIKQKQITVYDDVSYIENKTVYFKDGKQKEFDAIIAAVGFEHSNTSITGIENNRFNDIKRSIDKQEYFGKDGLYFCGFHISATGLICEIGLEAKKIAKHITGREKISQ